VCQYMAQGIATLFAFQAKKVYFLDPIALASVIKHITSHMAGTKMY